MIASFSTVSSKVMTQLWKTNSPFKHWPLVSILECIIPSQNDFSVPAHEHAGEKGVRVLYLLGFPILAPTAMGC